MSQAEFTRGLELRILRDNALERRLDASVGRLTFTRLELGWLAKVCARDAERRSP